ncbi:MAG: hypothetical protein AAFY38_13330 [Pseudomonadota bacterium]
MDPDKLLAELQAQEAKLDAELEKLGLGSFDDFDESKMWQGYPEIVRVAHEASDADLLPSIKQLIEGGADVNAASPYGETALDQCFARSAFAAVRCLIENGADYAGHEWSAAHLAIVMGQVPTLAAGEPAVMARDAAGRTPFLHACRLGNLAAAEALQGITPDEGRRATPDSEGPVTVAVRSGSGEMLDWVLAQGYDVDEADKFGGTGLMEAVERDDLALAERLLALGADVARGRNISAANAEAEATTSSFGAAANLIMKHTADLMKGFMPDADDVITRPADAAHSPEMKRLLVRYGADVNDFEAEDIAIVTGADRIAETRITPEMFNAQSAPRAGQANPEQVDIPFWREQIRTGRSGYRAEMDCTDARHYGADRMPVWSFQRFGRTATRLPDGRWVLIAGEHEDHYDPDFHIYADVTVIHPDARVDHYIYPADVFPPTDFHTATWLEDHILLIGSLGYQGQRHAGETQVLRLNLADFSVQAVATSGQNPGWISRHDARLVDRHIIVSGGKIEPDYVDNTDTFLLDLGTMDWTRWS